MLGDADGASARPATAVRRAGRLVQIEVDDIEPHIAGPRDAHDRRWRWRRRSRAGRPRHARACAISTIFSSKSPSVFGLVIISAAILPACPASICFEMIHVHAATRVRLQFDGVVVGQGRAGGIGAVRAIGDKHDVAVALAAMRRGTP